MPPLRPRQIHSNYTQNQRPQTNFLSTYNRPLNNYNGSNSRHFSHQPQPQPFNQHANPQPFQQPTFPSQPVNIQTRPIQRHFPSSRQVFGKPKNVFDPKYANRPTHAPEPMDTSSRNFSVRSNNHFKRSGPSNFAVEELHNTQYDNFPQQYEQQYESYDDYYQNDEPYPKQTSPNHDFDENQQFTDNSENFPIDGQPTIKR